MKTLKEYTRGPGNDKEEEGKGRKREKQRGGGGGGGEREEAWQHRVHVGSMLLSLLPISRPPEPLFLEGSL